MGIASEFLKSISQTELFEIVNFRQAVIDREVLVIDATQTFYRIPHAMSKTCPTYTEVYDNYTECFSRAAVVGDLSEKKNDDGTTYVVNKVVVIDCQADVLNAFIRDTIDFATYVRHIQEQEGDLRLLEDVVLCVDGGTPFAKKNTVMKRVQRSPTTRWLAKLKSELADGASDILREARLKLDMYTKDNLPSFPYKGSPMRLLSSHAFKSRLLNLLQARMRSTYLQLPFRIYLLQQQIHQHHYSSGNGTVNSWWKKIYGTGSWSELETLLATVHPPPMEADILSAVVNDATDKKVIQVSTDTDGYMNLMSCGTDTVLIARRPLITVGGEIAKEGNCLMFTKLQKSHFITPSLCLDMLLILSLSGSDYHQPVPEFNTYSQKYLFRVFETKLTAIRAGNCPQAEPFPMLVMLPTTFGVKDDTKEKRQYINEVQQSKTTFCFRLRDEIFFFEFVQGKLTDYVLMIAKHKAKFRSLKGPSHIEKWARNPTFLKKIECNLRRQFFLIEYMTHCCTNIDTLVKQDKRLAAKYGFTSMGLFLHPFEPGEKKDYEVTVSK